VTGPSFYILHLRLRIVRAGRLREFPLLVIVERGDSPRNVSPLLDSPSSFSLGEFVKTPGSIFDYRLDPRFLRRGGV
jgi:hypothetical protein